MQERGRRRRGGREECLLSGSMFGISKEFLWILVALEFMSIEAHKTHLDFHFNTVTFDFASLQLLILFHHSMKFICSLNSLAKVKYGVLVFGATGTTKTYLLNKKCHTL